MSDAVPDSGEEPLDPSHLGRQPTEGLREGLSVTTPQGGFVAPKTVAERPLANRVAVPVASLPPKIQYRDAPSRLLNAATHTAVPRDRSRIDPSVLPAGIRAKDDKRALVIGVVAAVLVLLAVGLLVQQPSAAFEQTSPAPTPKAAAAPQPVPAPQPATPFGAPLVEPVTSSLDAPQPAPPKAAASARPSAADSPAANKKALSASPPAASAQPAPVVPKTNPRFDPRKPWEED